MVTTIYNLNSVDYMMFESSAGVMHVLAPGGYDNHLILSNDTYKVSAIPSPSEAPVGNVSPHFEGTTDADHVEVTNVGEKGLLFYLRTYGPHVSLKPGATAVLQDKEYEVYIKKW